MTIYISRIGELGDGGGRHEVDFRVRKRFEGRHGELFGERVYFGVFEELVAGLVNGGGG